MVTWFEFVKENFDDQLLPLAGTPVQALQIGAYKGEASVWLLDNVLTNADSHLVDVDTWQGSDEHYPHEHNFVEIEAAYDHAIKPYANVTKVKASSDEFFSANTRSFTFIYVDGDHASSQVWKDAVNSFQVLSVGGVLAFDDYLWSPHKFAPAEASPRLAIDKFLDEYALDIEVLVNNYQVWVRKVNG